VKLDQAEMQFTISPQVTSHKDEALIVSSIPFFNIEKSAVFHSNRLCDSKVLCLPTTISFQAVVR
jgi:hypothetical protein